MTQEAIRMMFSIQASPDVGSIRTAQLQDKEYTVIPCIALVEGVLWPSNAPHPELALAEEFGRFAEGWNGRPVMMGHPKVNGAPVSASHPEVLETEQIGMMFNTELKDSKLHTEIWVNNGRVEELGERAQKTLERLTDGDEVVEVSTGLFAMQEFTEGEYNGQTYNAVWRNIVPDHLAILDEGDIGACSVEGGCGAPRLNEGQQFKPAMKGTVLINDCHCDENKDCACGGNPVVMNDDAPGKEGLFKRIMNKFGSKFSFRNDSGLSDRDKRQALQSALSEVTEEMIWILAIYDDVVVYEQGWGESLYQRSYSIQEGGAVTVGSDAIAVRPEIKFVPLEITTNEDPTINSTETEDAMSKEALVKALIENEQTKFTSDDEAWLLEQSEETLAKFEPVANQELNLDDDEGIEQPDATVSSDSERVLSTDEYIAKAPEEIREVLNSGLAMHNQRKQFLIKGLLANARNKFTEDQLKSKSLDELTAIADLANVPSYQGQAPGSVDAGTLVDNADGEDNFVAAPNVLEAASNANAS